jgi:hypothetical protein
VNRLLATGLCAALVLAACSHAPHLVGQEIDGFLVDGERSCALPPGDDCAPQLAVALAQLTPEERSAVSAAAIGGEPSSYEDSDGHRILLNRAGLTHDYGVILDIAGKQRRVIPVVCGRLEPATGEAQVNFSCRYAPDSSMRVGSRAP